MKYFFTLVVMIGPLVSTCAGAGSGSTPTVRVSPLQPPVLQTLPPAATPPLPTVESGVLLPTVSPVPVVPDSGWQPLRSGLERRIIKLFEAETEIEQLYMLRIDPAYYRFDLAYQDAVPNDLAAWLKETEALIVLNGGYFRREDDRFIPTGLTVVKGQIIGESFGPFAGMFAVTAQGPELRWLQQTPYDPQESLVAALQSFPLLVKPGGKLGFPEELEDGRQARRSVVGQDRDGRILFLVAGRGYFTLHRLSVYLAQSDLDLNIALNLDGGPSSGVLVANPAESIPAFSPLPLVITVYPR